MKHCNCKNSRGLPKPLKVALTTGNNIYYSRLLSSIYLHSELFESEDSLEIIKLQEEKKQAVKNEEYGLAEKLNNRIKELESKSRWMIEVLEIPDSLREMIYQVQ